MPFPTLMPRSCTGSMAVNCLTVFGTLDRTPSLWPKAPATPEEAALSDAMVDYWSSFVRTGHPEAKGDAPWPQFGATGAYMDFTDAPHAAENLLPGMYQLNEEVVCRRRAKGDVAWNWNMGLASPPLPDPAPNCK